MGRPAAGQAHDHSGALLADRVLSTSRLLAATSVEENHFHPSLCTDILC